MNTQPIEKLVKSPEGTLEVHSVFFTIQGEGPHCGRTSVFIRLAGCNLQCPGCDTDYTSNRERKSVSVLRNEVLELIEDECGSAYKPLIVITGGEPFRQDISHICKTFLNSGFDVQIETNGTLPPPAGMPEGVDIVVSPKTGKINEEIAELMTAMKYVVKAGAVCKDGLPSRALDHTCSPVVAKPPKGFPQDRIYIQPMDEQHMAANRRNTEAAKTSVMQNGYTLQIQVHKVIGVE